MYKQCKSERSATRQRELEQALLDMLENHWFEDISVSGLCRVSGVPRKAFYRYFSDKKGALVALLDHTWMECETGIAQGVVRNGYGMEEFLQFFQFWYRQRPLLEALQRNGLAGLLMQRALILSRKERTVFVDFELAAADALRDEAMLIVVGSIVMLIIEWTNQNFAQSCESMAQTAMELLTSPLLLQRSRSRWDLLSDDTEMEGKL